jgi:putative transcriptional regulator
LTFWNVYITIQTMGNVSRLGNRLRVVRAEDRLSQEQLARLAGVTRQTISAIENGQYCPSARLAFVMARELKRPITDLFFLEDEAS